MLATFPFSSQSFPLPRLPVPLPLFVCLYFQLSSETAYSFPWHEDRKQSPSRGSTDIQLYQPKLNDLSYKRLWADSQRATPLINPGVYPRNRRAVTGRARAELIFQRVCGNRKESRGKLETSWKNLPTRKSLAPSQHDHITRRNFPRSSPPGLIIVVKLRWPRFSLLSANYMHVKDHRYFQSLPKPPHIPDYMIVYVQYPMRI